MTHSFREYRTGNSCPFQIDLLTWRSFCDGMCRCTSERCCSRCLVSCQLKIWKSLGSLISLFISPPQTGPFRVLGPGSVLFFFKVMSNATTRISLKPSFILFYLFLAVAGSSLLRGLSLIAVSGAYPGCGVRASHCSGFSHCGAQALGHVGFSSCGSRALEHRSCGTRALLLLGM